MKKLFFLFFLSLLFKHSLNRASTENKHKFIKKGNLALPITQEPGPLFRFGQNIIDKGNLMGFVFIDSFRGRKKNFIDTVPAILYGITDSSSIFVVVPFANYRLNANCSSGIEDIFVQGEYAFYNKETTTYGLQSTIVANVTLPTGSTKKNPTTGFGSASFLLGGTVSYTSINWYLYTQPAITITTKHCGTKFGNTILYQWGIGRNFAYNTDNWLFAGILEFDGTYSRRNLIGNVIDCNSGGNIIYAAPSLFFSTKRLILQFGVGFPIVQHLFGTQIKNRYFIAANIGWTFH